MEPMQAMQRLTTLYIDKESHKFSAAHYTIFSARERERLHGHNYSIAARIVAPVGENGFSMLLAGDSPFQTIEEDGACYRVTFAGVDMSFLKSDTLVLPILNATVEEFSHYLLTRLLQESEGEDLREIELCVASGPGQRACSLWRAEQ
jgi:6-pyruvoyltetrahydropterin/6-carboxytetrahydropterin synthase